MLPPTAAPADTGLALSVNPFSGGKLTSKVAVVTGASRGIGAAVALALAAEGAAVCVAHEPTRARTDAALEIVERIRVAGGRAAAVSADLADPASIIRLAAETRRTLGPVDIVINNAAASPRSDWRVMTVEEWDLVQAVNTRAGWLLVRACFPDLCASASPAVVNVTSTLAQSGGNPGALHYTTSKAAVIGMTRAMARELGLHGVRVNAVMPGAIRTEDEIEREPDEAAINEIVLGKQSLKRRGLADDVVGAFLFLAGPDSAFITGQVLNVDGGWIHY